MRIVRPGDTYRDSFTTQGGTGAAAAADSLPTAAAFRNGTADGAVTVTVASAATGAYVLSFAVPGTYAPGDVVQALVTAVIGGLTVRGWSSPVTLSGYPATALPNAAAGAAGGVPLGDASGEVTLADGVTHGGASALLRLGSSTVVPALWVTSSGGTAARIESTAAGFSHALRLQGGTGGNGLYAEGGAEGNGADFWGGAAGGAGILCEAQNPGYSGLDCRGAAGGYGIEGPLSPLTLASFFTTDSGSAYGDAVAGSVVKETADNAAGGGEVVVAPGGLDEVLVAGKTLPDALRIIGAAVAGPLSGSQTDAEAFSDFAGVPSHTVEADEDGNRLLVTYT